LDYGLVIGIIVIIALWGFLAGVGIGLVVACMLFAFNYSRTGAIKQTFTGLAFRSNRDRAFSEQNVLDTTGQRIYVVRLQGYLFFGTSYPLLMHVRQKMEETDTAYVILDFAAVTRIDSSAVMSISKLLQAASAKKTVIIAVNLKNDVEELLWGSGCLARPVGSRLEGRALFFSDLDHALEWCEERLIESSGLKSRETPIDFRDHFLHLFEKPEMIPRFLKRLEKLDVPAGFVLFEKGAPGSDLFFVESGEVTASIDILGGGEKRLRTMGEGTVVGEMGLYMGILRSATVRVERPAVLYKLSRENLADLEKEDPELANTLHRFFIKHLAYRLMRANEEMALIGT
jgi:SulP family sulfate permease